MSKRKPQTLTREQWLEKSLVLLQREVFKKHATLPRVRVSTGFPSTGGTRTRNTTIGEIWHAESTADKVPQIFISPTISDGTRALDILIHELVHACTPGAGHKGPFKQLATSIGLEGKMTATVAGAELLRTLKGMVKKLGKYPHAQINVSKRKKEGTRLIKGECADCGYTVRVTRKWIDELGFPLCPCNRREMLEG